MSASPPGTTEPYEVWPPPGQDPGKEVPQTPGWTPRITARWLRTAPRASFPVYCCATMSESRRIPPGRPRSMGRRDGEEAPRAIHSHVHSTAPGEGERRAVGGYGNQYRVAGLLIVDGIDDLEWIRIADPAAGRVDDIQVATPGRLDAHQVKWGRTSGPVTWRSLLRASGKTPSPCSAVGRWVAAAKSRQSRTSRRRASDH
jgi:hypothetical protein